MKNARDMVTRPGSNVHWVRLVIAGVGLLAVSFAIAYLLRDLEHRFNLPLNEFDILTYAIVFVTSLISNMTIIAPVPFAISIMIAAAQHWNPITVAFAAALGGTIGELSGYYAGYLGKKIAIPESLIGYHKLETWINKNGFWAILILGFQPIIPFDLGGLIAGAAKMPLHKFFPALFLGKFPKYVIMTVVGMEIFSRIPFLSP